ncbi:hypothetical protein AAJ76_3600023778 [Vairimorpha ceranae]|uniref:Uncharacterized protein n=1 Tax=Vairimorpha ceranae TaxID=40302 RepID=A0A0F9WBV5_9MICR|nr:hypothetical protein AAJ76_3600023778 [Vairimorpha ceranae]KKO75006.1 hypothetical protein AAJ76_3600023778 [Vairimorpha ceranae]
MSININCKKKWHPSRYETQKEITKINIQSKKTADYYKNKHSEHVRSTLNASDSERMSWMFDDV